MSIKQLILVTLLFSLSAQITADPIDCRGANGLSCCAGKENAACVTNNGIKDESGTCQAFIGLNLVRLILKKRSPG
jgi:hypothetical protein